MVKSATMFRRIIKMTVSTLMVLIVMAAAVILLPRAITVFYAHTRIYLPETSPRQRVAIVFGAGLWRDGRPSPVLRDRVFTAARLYFDGKVDKLLMSGDNRFEYYNEPGAMSNYALELGVPKEDIVLDYAGRRTYDTCYRARDIFGIRQAILVTQSFHLPRALYTCHILGITATGVNADRRSYRSASLLYWNLRETFATVVAVWELFISRPVPVLGNPEPIFPTEAQ